MPSVTRRSATGRERREAVAARVLEAVEALLESGESYTSLGVGRIADEAEIARSTFYVHFSDKTDLLLRLADEATNEVFGPLYDWVRGDDAGDLDRLERTLVDMVAGFRRHRRMLIAFNEVAAYDATVAAYWRARVERFARHLARRLRTEHGDTDTDPDVTAAWMAWGVERAVSQHVATTKDPEGDERLAIGIARAIWHQLTSLDRLSDTLSGTPTTPDQSRS